MEVSDKLFRSRLKKIRNSILKHLDKKGWIWNYHLSNLLCQVDAALFGMRQNIKEKDKNTVNVLLGQT